MRSFVLLSVLALLALPVHLGAGVIDAECSFINTGLYGTTRSVKLYGTVKIVTEFPDVKVKIVTSNPDLKVQLVPYFADSCGEWQMVPNFADLKVQFVKDDPDITIMYVDSFPGIGDK